MTKLTRTVLVAFAGGVGSVLVKKWIDTTLAKVPLAPASIRTTTIGWDQTTATAPRNSEVVFQVPSFDGVWLYLSSNWDVFLFYADERVQKRDPSTGIVGGIAGFTRASGRALITLSNFSEEMIPPNVPSVAELGAVLQTLTPRAQHVFTLDVV